jgi:hypothetical protein
LARFNNFVNYHRHDTDSVEVASIREDASSGSRGGASFAPTSAPLTVDFVDLMLMAFSSATSDEMFQKRRDFALSLRQRGGYCLVTMSDDAEAGIVDGMWDLMERLFGDSADPADDMAHRLRRQVLKRNSTSPPSSSDQPGYDFVQTSLEGGSVRPEWIGEQAGAEGARQAGDAYMLLAQLCKAFAVVAYAGTAGVSPSRATALVDSLLTEDGPGPSRPFSGSYHRLCRYLPLEGSTGRNGDDDDKGSTNPSSSRWGESLRPHVDWTISTAIPVSSIAGLEVYDLDQPRSAAASENSPQPTKPRRWVRVEEAAHKFSTGDKGVANGSRKSPPFRWNSRYVLVFAGAWLELLTGGELESTLHRVVSSRAAASPRLSAPFFLRPHERVFERMDQVFDDPENDEIVALDPRQTVREMSRFLHESDFRRL